MAKRYFIITGSSRGIGKAISALLLKNGDYVTGISRNDTPDLLTYPNFRQILFDLSRVNDIPEVIEAEIAKINHRDIDMVCLINNAAMVEPLKPIEECSVEEISANLHISLMAPILLTSCFIKHTKGWQMRKKVINISSGSGRYANPSMSIYSTAKAGLNMFTRCVGIEQNDQNQPVEIMAVEPGMVDTDMQLAARSVPEEQFAMAKYFRESYSTGQLQSTEEIAAHVFRIIGDKFENGRIINYLDREN